MSYGVELSRVAAWVYPTATAIAPGTYATRTLNWTVSPQSRCSSRVLPNSSVTNGLFELSGTGWYHADFSCLFQRPVTPQDPEVVTVDWIPKRTTSGLQEVVASDGLTVSPASVNVVEQATTNVPVTWEGYSFNLPAKPVRLGQGTWAIDNFTSLDYEEGSSPSALGNSVGAVLMEYAVGATIGTATWGYHTLLRTLDIPVPADARYADDTSSFKLTVPPGSYGWVCPVYDVMSSDIMWKNNFSLMSSVITRVTESGLGPEIGDTSVQVHLMDVAPDLTFYEAHYSEIEVPSGSERWFRTSFDFFSKDGYCCVQLDPKENVTFSKLRLVTEKLRDG